MTKLGIVLDYSKQRFAWGEIEVPMLPIDYQSTKSMKQFWNNKPEENNAIINDTKQKQSDLEDVAEIQTHLKENQRNNLIHVLNKYQSIIKVKRGSWMGQEVNIEFKSNSTPYHTRSCHISDTYKEPLRKEIARL